jgi:hypothetical protein
MLLIVANFLVILIVALVAIEGFVKFLRISANDGGAGSPAYNLD